MDNLALECIDTGDANFNSHILVRQLIRYSDNCEIISCFVPVWMC